MKKLMCLCLFYSWQIKISENAESYKEEGNRHFKIKKYIWAIDNYTAGIKENCADKTLNAILYSNRAAANYHRGKFLTFILIFYLSFHLFHIYHWI